MAKDEEVKEIATEDVRKVVEKDENTTSNSSKPGDDDKQESDKREEQIQINHCEEPTKSPLK